MSIQSHKRAFILKLVMLFPLSWGMFFLAAMLTGGGHGNFLPIMVTAGPLYIMFCLVDKVSFDIAGMCMLLGTAFLYPFYGLLLRYIKGPWFPTVLAVIHIVSSIVWISKPGEAKRLFVPKDIAIQYAVWDVVIFALWASIIWILVLIRRDALKSFREENQGDG